MNLLWKSINRLALLPTWFKTILGLGFGILAGYILGSDSYLLQPIGTIFINAIMMMVGPVIFVSIVSGVVAMKDPVKMGRIALKSFLIFLAMTVIGTSIALLLCTQVFAPGKNITLSDFNLSLAPALKSTPALSLVETVVGLFPANIFSSFMEGNLLQIITFSFLFGIAINFTGPAGRPVERLIDSLSQVTFKLVSIIMSFTPVGVFALMAVVTGTQGSALLASLFELLGVIYVSFAAVLFLVYASAMLVSRINPLPFMRKMLEIQTVAFSTASSAATIPVNLQVTTKKMGVPKNIASFVIPLGSTINMNGLATYLGVIAVFAANLYGVELNLQDYIKIVATSAIAAIGCAGVPGGGLVVLPMVLGSVGIPVEVVGLIAGINRFIDLGSTVVNSSGDSLTAVLVAKSENELDVATYNSITDKEDDSEALKFETKRRFEPVVQDTAEGPEPRPSSSSMRQQRQSS